MFGLQFKKAILVGEFDGEPSYVIADIANAELSMTVAEDTKLCLETYLPEGLTWHKSEFRPMEDISVEEFLHMIGEGK